MKTKLAKETRLNQTKNDLINELMTKNKKSIVDIIGCEGRCAGGGIFF